MLANLSRRAAGLVRHRVSASLRSDPAFAASLLLLLDSRAFCPTGPGGGQDNSCGPDGGGATSDEPKLPGLEVSDIEAAAKWGKRAYREWGKTREIRHKNALDDYISGGSTAINARLRAGRTTDLKDRESVEEGNRVLRVMHAMKGAVVPEDIIVYRGLNGGGGSDETGESVSTEFDGEHVVGETYQDRGFMSTTMVRAHAEEAYGDPEMHESPTILRLSVPKGTRGAYVDAASKHPTGEAELLLWAGTKYKVEAVTNDAKGRRIVHGTVVR